MIRKIDDTSRMQPIFYVLPVYNFRSKRFLDKAFRTQRGARAALAETNRIRAGFEMKPLEIWWIGGKPERIVQ